MKRRRHQIVPDDAVECFEVRAALYYNSAGDAMVGYNISTPDEPDASPPLHEVLGVMRFAEEVIIDGYGGSK